eukprot:TRINITY_DN756_c1_g3_i1.p1 TRINITY_DN756_c1_g3~~TRINITY_DN756_c1_g3_i1.p1  ORF type:complete len:701 (+),score=313.50 TRINITY_DN756_c1_g3_i1:209-2104(+)
MLYSAVTRAPEKHRVFVGKYIRDGKLNSKQCDAAVKHLIGKKDADVDVKAFEAECGAGVVVSRETITTEVAAAIAKQKADIEQQRYKFNTGRMLGDLRKTEALKWADGEAMKEEVDKQVTALLGPRTAEDDAGDKKKKEKAAPKAAEKKVFDPSKQTDAQKKLLDDACGYKPTLLKDVPTLKNLDQEYVVRGWAHIVRQQKNMCFVILRDGTGVMQCVVKDKNLPEIAREASFAFRGKINHEPKAAKNEHLTCPPFEMSVSEWAIFGMSDPDINNVLNEDTDVHQRLEQRHMMLRSSNTAMLMRVRSFAMKAFRDHFFDKGCMEVQPPTIVQTQCEGGSSLFDLQFYGETAYMTQSSQLYLETAIPMIGDCFCILPSYRAEKSKTKRHLSEFTHIEAEYPFIDFEDLLNRLEELMVGVLTLLMKWCGNEIRTLNPGPMKNWTDDGTDSWKDCYIPKRPFKRLTHADAIKFCREHNIYKTEPGEEGHPMHFGDEDDIPDRPERAMVAKIGEPVFMMNFPTSIKSFYMKRVEGHPDLTESVDLLMPGIGEIIGGSMRIHEYDELMQAYEREKFDPAPYYWFTDQRKYGTSPHGGFGLGLERFLVWLCNDVERENVDHVRETCLFPRLMGRCTP